MSVAIFENTSDEGNTFPFFNGPSAVFNDGDVPLDSPLLSIPIDDLQPGIGLAADFRM